MCMIALFYGATELLLMVVVGLMILEQLLSLAGFGKHIGSQSFILLLLQYS